MFTRFADKNGFQDCGNPVAPMITGLVHKSSSFLTCDRLWPSLVAETIVWASSRVPVVASDAVSFDKVAHFSVYGRLAILALRAIGVGVVPWLTVSAVSLFGFGDAWHPSFFQRGRAGWPIGWLILGEPCSRCRNFPVEGFTGFTWGSP
jgi:hypothetical protein